MSTRVALCVLLALCSCARRITITLSPAPDVEALVTDLVGVLNEESKCAWVRIAKDGHPVTVDNLAQEARADMDAVPAAIVMPRIHYRDAWDAHFYGQLGVLVGVDVDSRWNNDPVTTRALLLSRLKDAGVDPCGVGL